MFYINKILKNRLFLIVASFQLTKGKLCSLSNQNIRFEEMRPLMALGQNNFSQNDFERSNHFFRLKNTVDLLFLKMSQINELYSKYFENKKNVLDILIGASESLTKIDVNKLQELFYFLQTKFVIFAEFLDCWQEDAEDRFFTIDFTKEIESDCLNLQESLVSLNLIEKPLKEEMNLAIQCLLKLKKKLHELVVLYFRTQKLTNNYAEWLENSFYENRQLDTFLLIEDLISHLREMFSFNKKFDNRFFQNLNESLNINSFTDILESKKLFFKSEYDSLLFRKQEIFS